MKVLRGKRRLFAQLADGIPLPFIQMEIYLYLFVQMAEVAWQFIIR